MTREKLITGLVGYVCIVLVLYGLVKFLKQEHARQAWEARDNVEDARKAEEQKRQAAEKAIDVGPSFDPFAAIDEALSKMMLANVVFNTPETINIDDAATIQLLLSLSRTVEELSKEITAKGKKEGVNIKVSDRMEALLRGLDFEITPPTAIEQAISAKEHTEWKWKIRPLAAGEKELQLTLTAKFYVDGVLRARQKTFDRTIKVEATAGQQWTRFLGNNWPWLWVVVFGPAALWLRHKRSTQGQTMCKVFISYRRDDSAGYAQAIHGRLVTQLSKERVFMDVDTIEPGVDFVRAVEQAVAECDVLIAIIGKRWLQNEGGAEPRLNDPKDLVRVEISTALARGIRVIPVLVDSTMMPSEEILPPDLQRLARINAIEISTTRFQFDLDRVTAAVRQGLVRKAA
jgi:hypothetical protein